MIKLTCGIGYSTGWFGWWYYEGETLTGQYFYIEGFPGDNPYADLEVAHAPHGVSRCVTSRSAVEARLGG